MKAILVRPRFDEVTPHTFAFAEEILQWCHNVGISVLDLAEAKAVRQGVEQELTTDIDLFIFYDHGDKDCLVGQDEKPVIDLNNCDRLANKEVFTLACLSAKELGAEVWRGGGKYWGYTEIVSFTTDALDVFQTAFNCGFHYRFIEGETHENALKWAKQTFNDLAIMLVDTGRTMAALCMRSNCDALVYYNAHKPGEEKPGGCLLALLKVPFLKLRWPKRI